MTRRQGVKRPRSAVALKITLLGTGTPFPSAERLGSAILVEAGGKKLLFDCGRGAVIRLTQAGVRPSDIDALFLTHLHSDHVVGSPDLWLTGWFLGRKEPLRIWGPQKARSMTEGLVQAYAFDVEIRASTEGLPARGARIDAHEIEEGQVYDNGATRVTAFTVDHGRVRPAFGYRVDYAGHSAVISGDTRFSENLVKFAEGTDCLIHAAWSVGARNSTPPGRCSIASAEDAARLFATVRPRLAVIYHYKVEEGVADSVRAGYTGSFVIARDLMMITIGPTITWKNGSSKGRVTAASAGDF